MTSKKREHEESLACPKVGNVVVVKWKMGNKADLSFKWYEGVITKCSRNLYTIRYTDEVSQTKLPKDQHTVNWYFKHEVTSDFEYVPLQDDEQMTSERDGSDGDGDGDGGLHVIDHQWKKQVDLQLSGLKNLYNVRHEFETDVDGLRKEIDERFTSIQNEISKLHKEHEKIKLLLADDMIFDTFGVFTKQDEIIFNEQESKEIQKFVRGPWVGVTYNSKTMCSMYKNIMSPCLSRQLNADGIYESDKGEHMAIELLGKTSLRKKHAVTACKLFKQYAVCGNCKASFLHKKSIDIVRWKQNCTFCKVNSSSTFRADDETTLALCRHCDKHYTVAADHESLLQTCLKSLIKVFPQYNLTIGVNFSVNTINLETGKNSFRRIDLLLSGSFENIMFYIIVELDPNQHKGEDSKKETNKMLEQLSRIIKGTRSDKQVKVMCVRLNPNSTYFESTHQTERHSEYTRIQRFVIFRQHLIFYMLNIERMRTMVNAYMWYDMYDKNRDGDKYFAPGWEGTTFLYHAPKCPPQSDWMYCFDPVESQAVDRKAYRDIKERAKDMNEVFPKWCREREVYDYPNRLKALLSAPK